VQAAERVKAFSSAMGHASVSNLHAMVRSGRTVGLDFSHQDIDRAEKIFGKSVQAIRGKTMRKKTRFADPVVGKIVEPNLVMHTDIMFVAGLPFLTSVFKPLMLLLSTLIKSKQVSTVQGEGFKVIEITSDGEGAVGAIKDDLDRLGCKVTIHSKNTSSADVDNKIRQLKNTMRSASVLRSRFWFSRGSPYLNSNLLIVG
jgi:hypothetical protein